MCVCGLTWPGGGKREAKGAKQPKIKRCEDVSPQEDGLDLALVGARPQLSCGLRVGHCSGPPPSGPSAPYLLLTPGNILTKVLMYIKRVYRGLYQYNWKKTKSSVICYWQ